MTRTQLLSVTFMYILRFFTFQRKHKNPEAQLRHATLARVSTGCISSSNFLLLVVMIHLLKYTIKDMPRNKRKRSGKHTSAFSKNRKKRHQSEEKIDVKKETPDHKGLKI